MTRATAAITWLMAAAASLLLPAVAFTAAEDELAELLFRANQYVVEYQKQLSGLVAQEEYTQRIVRENGEIRRSRELKSDYLLVTVPGDGTWRGFRDVYEVDGQGVRDRADRLLDLFVHPTGSAHRQAQNITAESARYNIGQIWRNFNLPTMALLFLDPINQHRFHFELAGRDAIEGAETDVVHFTEHSRPTFIQVPAGARSMTLDIFSRGRFWISPPTGRVVKSELVTGGENLGVLATVTVTYAPEDAVKLWVPVVMDEKYADPRNPRADVITGLARYSHYRAFAVSTDYHVR